MKRIEYYYGIPTGPLHSGEPMSRVFYQRTIPLTFSRFLISIRKIKMLLTFLMETIQRYFVSNTSKLFEYFFQRFWWRQYTSALIPIWGKDTLRNLCEITNLITRDVNLRKLRQIIIHAGRLVILSMLCFRPYVKRFPAGITMIGSQVSK